MIVGFLRKKNTPPKLARLLSYTCNYHGISLIYMTPEGINMTKGTVQGKMLINNVWESVEVSLPKYIDVNPHLFNSAKDADIMKYLKENTNLSIDRRNIIKKDVLQDELKKHPSLYKYGIPSAKVTSFQDLLQFLYKNKQIVVKPVNGLQGKSVMVIKILDENQFIIGEQKKETVYNIQELEEFYNSVMKKTKYLMQKYIVSRTNLGDPFDCSIHLEKGANNEWKIANMFIRIGIEQSVVSNVSQSGGISRVNSFLEVNYTGKAKQIEKQLHQVSTKIAVEIERITKTQLATMGLDVGIDPYGRLYVFEINSYPIVSPQMSEITVIRPQYYKYMLELNENKLKKKEHDEITKVLNENRKLKRQLNQIKTSTSWKVTKAIRGIGRSL